MPTYITLGNYTDQGIRTIKELPERYRRTLEQVEKAGVRVHGWYLTMGAYDWVTVIEAPDDQTMTRALLALGMQGNVRTNTLKAFTFEEAEKIVRSLP